MSRHTRRQGDNLWLVVGCSRPKDSITAKRSRPRMFLSCFVAAFFAIAALAQAEEKADGSYFAGLATTTFSGGLGEAEMGIWYPSTTSEEPHRLGGFDATSAKDGEPALGSFPVVLFSHGNGGRWRNHHLTAAMLARAGFIVVAPTHLSDRAERSGDVSIAAAVGIRATDLTAALKEAMAHPAIENTADAKRLAIVGYSLGGASALIAAGGRPTMEAFWRHCLENSDDDPACSSSSLLTKAVQVTMHGVRKALAGLRSLLGKPPRKLEYSGEEVADLPPPLDFRAVILVAPVGAPFADEDSLAEVSTPVMIHRMAQDDVLAYPFHAENLKNLLVNPEYRVHEAYHYSFIAPFADRVEKNFPGSLDPEGFDRSVFISEINEEILTFLRPLLAKGS